MEKMTDVQQRLNENVDEVIKCQLCSHVLNDPRILPCFHSFCFTCLKKWINEKKNPQDKVDCPLCQQEFKIPEDGYTGLKKNYFVERLLELRKISTTLESPCDICSEERSACDQVNVESIEKAQSYCVECQQKLCKACTHEHSRQKLLKSHSIVSLGENSRINELGEKMVPSFCDTHAKEVVKMYCVNCETVICVLCFAESHQSHSCLDINKAVDIFQGSLGEIINSLKVMEKEDKEMETALETDKKDLAIKLKVTRESVTQKCQLLKDIVDRHAELLLKELDSEEVKEMQDIEAKALELKKAKKLRDNYFEYLSALKLNGSPSDICQSSQKLKLAVESFLENHKEHIQPNGSPKVFHFIPADLTSYEQNESNILGSLSTYREDVNIEQDNALPEAGKANVGPFGASGLGGGFVSGRAGGIGETTGFLFNQTQGFGHGCTMKKSHRVNVCTMQTVNSTADQDEPIITVKEMLVTAEKEKRSEIQLMSLQLVATFGNMDTICGITTLNSLIWVLMPTCITVYQNYTAIKTILLPPEIEINRLEADIMTSDGSYLYLGCSYTVWMVEVSGDQRATIWMSSNDCITSISAANGRILLGTFDLSKQCAVLTMYDQNRKLFHKFMMPPERKSLHRILYASNGNIILSFNASNEVFEMNMQGVIFRSYSHPSNCYQHYGNTTGISPCFALSSTLFIGYDSTQCQQCSSSLVALDSDFHLRQVVLPNAFYNKFKFQYICFNNMSQLIAVCRDSTDSMPTINVFNISNG